MRKNQFWAMAIGAMFFLTSGVSFAMNDETSLKVLTFNTWLLDIPVYPFGLRRDVSLDMNERLRQMPDALAETQADVLVLQEVWSQSSKDTLIREMRNRGYPYAAYTTASRWFLFFQTAMGDGLLILSKLPISSRALHYDFSKATQSIESYASKGVMKVQIKHPTQGWIDLYASHLGAVEFENGNYNPEQLALHELQLTELSQFIQKTRSNPVAILASDLNMHYKKWDQTAHEKHFVNEFSAKYLSLKKSACGLGQNLKDTYLATHHKMVQDEADYTFDQKNHYVGGGYYGALPSEVEDYIFVCDNTLMKPTDSSIVFRNKPLSDHYGVLTTFKAMNETHEFRLASE